MYKYIKAEEVYTFIHGPEATMSCWLTRSLHESTP